MLKKLVLALAIAAPAAAFAHGHHRAVAAPAGVQVGILTCDVDAHFGLVLGSQTNGDCYLDSGDGRPEYYSIQISRLGIDLGITGPTRMVWLVFNAQDNILRAGGLDGAYVGSGVDASFIGGGGVKFLVGGSNKNISLQPWSGQGQLGFNLAATLMGVTLQSGR